MSWASGAEIAQAVASGASRALNVVDDALARIEAHNPVLNAFTAIVADRAREKARAIDASPDKAKLPLAGVPFAVKNLFDIEGLATVAGSKINRARPPATRDSPLIERLEAAGAVLVGALNMGEYAYDFTGENVHDGPSRNPHDVTRMTGGSSGGSGAAVGGGLVPLALGSDTNGSIRVPSSLCGIFGLKPTYGRLSRARSFPFVASLDHLGPFARSARDLALSYDAMQGYDADDAACVDRPAEPATPSLGQGLSGLRIAVAGGYFKQGAFPEALEALERVAKAAGARDGNRDSRSGKGARRGLCHHCDGRRGAASRAVAQSGARFRSRGARPPHRRRDAAGHAAQKAQNFRRWYRERVLELFARYDAILAPATPCTAPKIGQQTFVARWRRIAGAAQRRHLHPADLLHRPAGGGGAGAAQAAADRRANHRRAVARGYRAAHRACAGTDGRGGRTTA